AARREFHAEKWDAVLAFAHFVDRQYVRMIETRHRLRFTPKTRQRLTRIGVIIQDTLERDDPARMPLPRTIDDAHSTAPDLFQDLIIAELPIAVVHIDLRTRGVQ